MAGLPTRILRSILGPKFRDPRPVEHPEFEMAASAMNLLCQVAIGHGLVGPRASLVAAPTASALNITHQEEAWNDDHKQVHPTLSRSSAGVYSYLFGATYRDCDGASVALSLGAARASAFSNPLIFDPATAPRAFAWIDPAAPLDVQIRTWTGTTLTDYPFWLEVL